MCGTSAYLDYLEDTKVFSEVADILNASGSKAEVKEIYDKTGLVVLVKLSGGAATLNENGERGWRIDFGGGGIELGIPVENRDATAITAALLKAIGK